MSVGGLRSWTVAASRAESSVQYFSKDFDWTHLRSRAQPMLEVQRSKALAIALANEKDVEAPQTDASAQRWEAFHGQLHATGRFFRPRRYLLAAFNDLRREVPSLRVLELGCGSGSAAIPLLQQNRTVTVYAADFCKAALEAAERNAEDAGIHDGRFVPLIYDPTDPNGDPWRNLEVKPKLDGITMLFMLSAVRPKDMKIVLESANRLLMPGGKVFFRDYGLYDLTQLRFPPESMLGEKLYRRQDGTLAYFFEVEELRAMFEEAGFVPEELDYCCVRQRNRKRQLIMDRVFVHGVFRKKGTLF
mmetsp:Transcript_6389/g.39845  ORF Transcript_6389/g.39845 Transcript_6389/m.39845 type:complete len:303 (-) Transcript_6389:945-1853(-)